MVDDDREIRDLLAYGSWRSTASASPPCVIRGTHAEPGRTATTKLVVLDLVMLPGEPGLDFAETMSQSDVPVVMLTAMSEETDRIIGLEMGADDYVPKPFNPRGARRIRAVLRRAGTLPAHATTAAAARCGRRLDPGTGPPPFA